MPSGLRHLGIVDPESGSSFPSVVLYPSEAPTMATPVGPYTFDATLDAPIAAGRFPVCVISHGGGGSHLVYRSIAGHLARHGFIVVAPEHPGDNRNDGSLYDTIEAAANRPAQASLAIDAVLADARLGPAADAGRIGAIGHSMGGYTALALVGGHPWSRSGRPIPVRADPRVRAAVLLAPSTDWFRGPGSLADIVSPILVMTGAEDEVTPAAGISEVMAGLPAGVLRALIVVEGAGHFSFLTPFPEAMRRPGFRPATDPAGFDRERFHARLPAAVHAFLADAL